MTEPSNGYEAAAARFMAARSRIGAGVVREWARRVRRGGAVLDLGCGHGVPITQTLVAEGLEVYGIDASASLLAALRGRFSDVTVQCNAVEHSDFFGRTFDGIVAWGLLFLLHPDSQRLLVRKVSRALNPHGTWLFTAPAEACEWVDAITGRRSVSLGANVYRDLLRAEGLSVIREQQDEGGNHTYIAAPALSRTENVASAGTHAELSP